MTIIGTIAGTLGGWEAIKYFMNRKANEKKEDNEASHVEFEVLRETVVFLQEQLLKKEERFADQTELVRKLQKENQELSRSVAKLETERSLKLCERRGCRERQPESGY